jgi:hypothetical protein
VINKRLLPPPLIDAVTLRAAKDLEIDIEEIEIASPIRSVV